MKDRSCTHSRSSRRCSIIMQINASRCHPKLTADHYETARGEKQNFLSRLIEQNNKDVLHLCFIGCFLRKMRLGYNSNSFVVNIMIDKLNETVWRLNFGHINVTMTRSLGKCRRALERPKVALGCASSDSYASLELSKLPERIHDSMYTSWALNNSLLSQKLDRVFFQLLFLNMLLCPRKFFKDIGLLSFAL